MNVQEIKRKHWDFIVVGTGTGGATLGYALAKAGKEMLFVEKGRPLHHSTPAPLQGGYAETFYFHPHFQNLPHQEILARAGRYWDHVKDQTRFFQRTFTPHLGMGTGGSSSVYGMVMDRFFPEDFHPRSHYPHATDANVPESWPITYEELGPYYRQAEQLFEVRGGPDPLRPHLDPLPAPPLLSNANGALAADLTENGLHPYSMRLACRHVEGCQLCSGYLCPKECKRTALNTCLVPALAYPQTAILYDCAALRLETDHRKVKGVVCRHQNETFTLSGNTIVMAAGALHTPNILLQSPGEATNFSGQVGRNLMRQYLDFYAIRPHNREPLPPNIKEIAFNDFYLNDGVKLGTVQSFGHFPPARMLVGHLVQMIAESPFRGLRPLVESLKRPLEGLIRWKLGGRLVLTSFVEDLPYERNRVLPGSGKSGDTSFLYWIAPEDMKRIKGMREQMAHALRGRTYMRICQARNSTILPHICGTCRFGTDPKKSVLNRENRAHDLDNLYVVDSSFFPSSSGTDPSLTIVANALRVANLLKG